MAGAFLFSPAFKMWHQVDAMAAFWDADTHMHAADQQMLCDTAKGAAQVGVAFTIRVVLVFQSANGWQDMAIGGLIVFAGVARQAGAQAFQIITGHGIGRADSGADLDLARHEFRVDLTLQMVLEIAHLGGRGLGLIAGIKVVQQVFFFDVEGGFALHGAAVVSGI